MKVIHEIINSPLITDIDIDSIKNTPAFKNAGMEGFAYIRLPECGECQVVWGRNEGGWEHVSVAPVRNDLIPTWKDMCILKDVFWNDNEEVHQVHPKKSDYVNLVDNCLHLWRPIDGWKDVINP